MTKPTEDDIRRIIDDYERDKTTALARRDARLREAQAAGWTQAELIRATGYSRETMRKALNPEVREQLNAARRKTPADAS